MRYSIVLSIFVSLFLCQIACAHDDNYVAGYAYYSPPPIVPVYCPPPVYVAPIYPTPVYSAPIYYRPAPSFYYSGPRVTVGVNRSYDYRQVYVHVRPSHSSHNSGHGSHSGHSGGHNSGHGRH